MMGLVGIVVKPDKESSPDPSKPRWLYDAGLHEDFVKEVLEVVKKNGRYDTIVDGERVTGIVEKIEYMSDRVPRNLDLTPKEYHKRGKPQEVVKLDDFNSLNY